MSHKGKFEELFFVPTALISRESKQLYFNVFAIFLIRLLIEVGITYVACAIECTSKYEDN